jgi:hypothetical protein
MSSRRQADDDRPVTLGMLRKELRAAIEDYSPTYGADADSEITILRRELDELGEYIERQVGFAYDIYEWWQAGMPDEGATKLALLEQADRGVRRRDRYARAVLECREPDGTWPTQEAVAEALGVTTRALRDRAVGGWDAVLGRARELAGEAEPSE